jgi:PAS domain S-box-containing protein
MSGFLEFFQHLLASDFLPRGNCYYWQPGIVWLHAISDSLIAAAYYSIPISLLWVVRKRHELKFRSLVLMFASFITACGVTHTMSVWNVWHSAYRLEGLMKAITAGLSVATAIVTVRLAPTALKIVMPAQAERSHQILMEEMAARGQAEEELRHLAEGDRLASEAKLRSYFEAASQGILAFDRKGLIVLVNRRIEEMFGYKRVELLGKPLEILIPRRPSGDSETPDFFSEPSVRTAGRSGMKLIGRRKDRTEFPVEMGLSYLKGDEDVVALGLLSDITEQTRSLAEIERVNDELRRSNADLEQFAYVASHDLQEPLRMVTSYLNLLERRYKDRLDADAGEFIHFAVDGATRMKGLIQDLLRFSRVGHQVLHIREVDGEPVLQAALLNLKAAIDEHAAEVTADPLPTIPCDPGLLTQVFQNLIGNALKFHAEAKPRVHISAERVGAEWVFSVKDNGIGINPVHVDRIFRIFERLHNAEQYPGTGVGLAVVKKIVERHGGRIWVSSEPGQGATFLFSLPVEPVAIS